MELKKKKLRILIPVTSFGKAGGHRVLSELANNWIKSGHDVSIAAYYESHLPYYPVNAKIIWLDKNGIEFSDNIEPISSRSLKSRIHSLYKYLQINSKKYDVVLANHNISSIPTYFGSKSNNFYYIQAYEPEFYSKRNFKGITLSFIAWLSYFLPLKKIVNADIYRNYKNIKSKYVVPPGLDLSIYYPKNSSKKRINQIIIGCIGREEEWKGSGDVAEAVKLLIEEGYDVKFKVAFNPVKYDHHELVFPNGDNNLADFYRSLDILVAPGHIQLGAIHYPVIEAMACNVPVITTGYFPANDDNSYIVPVKDPSKIAEKILDIMKDYEAALKKAEKARQIIEEFEWKNVSDKFIKIFEENLKDNVH